MADEKQVGGRHADNDDPSVAARPRGTGAADPASGDGAAGDPAAGELPLNLPPERQDTGDASASEPEVSQAAVAHEEGPDADIGVEESEEPVPDGVGPQLRHVRRRAGLSLADVAAETRISLRHLESIERGDFSELAGPTYAIGFAKSYAKAVGLDQEDVAAMVRAEMSLQGPAPRPTPQTFEPGDPARVPSARLGLISIFAVILLLAGLFFAARLLFAPAAELPSLVEQQEQAQAQAQAAQAASAGPDEAASAADTPQGPVVVTAMEEGIWVRFYDSSEQRLMEKEMAEGESYTVPADVEGPQLWTGRPDALAISVGGRDIGRLAPEDMVMRDVSLTPEALTRRLAGRPAEEQSDPDA